jgi:hypothetical protein
MSMTLRRVIVKREEFDPYNKKHIQSLESFIRTGSWGSVQFFAELPHVEVPMTVLMKFVQHTLGVVPEGAKERSTRLSTQTAFLKSINS